MLSAHPSDLATSLLTVPFCDDQRNLFFWATHPAPVPHRPLAASRPLFNNLP